MSTAMLATYNRKTNAEDLVALWLEDAKQWGQKDAYLGKRRHRRYGWQGAMEIDVESIDGKYWSLGGYTRNISLGGIGLECRQPLEPHSRVHIRMFGQTRGVDGYVVHCGESLGRYIVGVMFAHDQEA